MIAARTLFVLCLLALARGTGAAEPNLHAPIESTGSTVGPGLTLIEASRNEKVSTFLVLRSPNLVSNPSVGWGTGHNLFVLCSLTGVAVERGYRQFGFRYGRGAGESFVALDPGTGLSAVGPDELYAQVTWVAEESTGLQDALIKGFNIASAEKVRDCAAVGGLGRSSP